ncbi:3-hydroxybutyryl-CoA dehydrogenase [Psychrobacillus sp. MER TA 17]|nr:3-hydroxybutyryl-CoA dehydrogenase [Psychrobacillus sp. MER TA 17]
MSMKTLMVIGAGQMGSGIAEVFAAKGFNVLLHDRELELAEKGKAGIKQRLERLVAKGYTEEQDVQQTLTRIKPIADIAACADAELVIEAATENMETKKQLFKRADAHAREGAILASNTSSLSITELASVTKRPEHVIGMHFMNPVPRMRLVEIIRGLQTSDAVYQQVLELTEALEKVAVTSQDYPGFIANRILMPMINEAIYTLYEGVASAEDIDTVMKLGMNHPMGPLTLADFIGLDTCLAIMEVLHQGFGDSKYRPCPLLRQYVQAGWLGRKTKRGFFVYE